MTCRKVQSFFLDFRQYKAKKKEPIMRHYDSMEFFRIRKYATTTDSLADSI